MYPERLVIVAEARVVAEHARVFSRDKRPPGQTIYDWRHYLSVAQRKPGALRNGAPFLELPDSFRALRARLIKRPGGDREMVDILALVLLHDEQQVERAVAKALEVGELSKQYIPPAPLSEEFSVIVLFSIVAGPAQYMPPPRLSRRPSTELPLIVLSDILAELPASQHIPPPYSAEFAPIVLFEIVGELPALQPTPPPAMLAVLSVIVLFWMVAQLL